MKKDNISIEWNRAVAEVLGDDSGVTGLRLESTVGELIKPSPHMGVCRHRP